MKWWFEFFKSLLFLLIVSGLAIGFLVGFAYLMDTYGANFFIGFLVCGVVFALCMYAREAANQKCNPKDGK